MSMKVFISLPMNGHEVDDIRNEMMSIYRMIDNQIEDDLELIDTVITDEPDDDILTPSVWYLGRSIREMSDADLVVFHPDWRAARGCIIEHMVCALYNIPYIDISMSDDMNVDDTVDYTHDWDIVGQVNAELSEAIAKAEGLVDDDDDTDNMDDYEDALGFEHDDFDDLIDSDQDPDILEPGEYNADIDVRHENS